MARKYRVLATINAICAIQSAATELATQGCAPHQWAVGTYTGSVLSSSALPGFSETGDLMAACCSQCVANPNCVAATFATAPPSCTLHANATGFVRTVTGDDRSTQAMVVRSHRQVHQAGRYGRWAADASSLPVYIYSFDQIADSEAHGPVVNRSSGERRWSGSPPVGNATSGCLAPPCDDGTSRGLREHSFQLGNDRLVVVGSNYGTYRVRQDEGGPKFLNDAVGRGSGAAGVVQFGGGFGYLMDDRKAVAATTAYTGGRSDRSFGIGYSKTECRHEAWQVEHTVAVPPGDEPWVLVEVEVTNTGTAAGSAVWAEVWGTAMVHQLTAVGWGGWAKVGTNASAMPSLLDRRSFAASHYISSFANFTNSSGVGLIQTRR